MFDAILKGVRMFKHCKTCKQFLDSSFFGKHKGRKDNLADSCKACRNKQMVSNRYNISQRQIDSMLESQNHVCAICKNPQIVRPGRLAIDHCHVTGKIRGMLCSNCNQGLGKFKDDMSLLEAAIDYLSKSKKNVDQ